MSEGVAGHDPLLQFFGGLVCPDNVLCSNCKVGIVDQIHLIMAIIDHVLQECWVMYQKVIHQYNSVTKVVICDSVICRSGRMGIADHFLQECHGMYQFNVILTIV